MCSTTHSLEAWEAAIKLLDQVKAQATAHSDPSKADSRETALLVDKLGLCLADFATKKLATPDSTWEALLQKQVGG